MKHHLEQSSTGKKLAEKFKYVKMLCRDRALKGEGYNFPNLILELRDYGTLMLWVSAGFNVAEVTKIRDTYLNIRIKRTQPANEFELAVKRALGSEDRLTMLSITKGEKYREWKARYMKILEKKYGNPKETFSYLQQV